MSGDYSRFGFDRLRDYNTVRLQQGRALTDRDWNELGTVINRRAQAGTLDTSAPMVVAAATPDAFKITTGGPGGLLIGRGRMYVDGLLAENHGAGAQKWDAAMAELYGNDPVAYNQQPYLPQPAPLPNTGKSLVYLDVWQREVTYIEDPDLVEKALGVDTTTRMQTVWQVKVLGPTNVPVTVDCATPLNQIPAWTDLIKPSGGRLTTATDPFVATDPCLVPPSGGYKGLENQLYRVEIHKAGPLGQATFKWSRDNASVATRVTRLIDPNHIVVESVGKDDLLRFSDGDWIEITDDQLELNGLAGELRQIKSPDGVDDATRTIKLENPPLPAGLFLADAQGNLIAGRHTRIRRWDQTGTAGDITVPSNGAKVALENGVLVSFGMNPTGGTFHVGDYWVFAACASDATIEILTDAPARGIHHHYAKLAVYTPPTTIEDCRPKPEECCCSISVQPGENIQTAINSLPTAGGCVCLKTGIHPIAHAITISRSNVKLVGESHGAIVRNNATGAVVQIGNAPSGTIEGVEISTIAFEGLGQANSSVGVVTIASVRRSALTDCVFKTVTPRVIGVATPALPLRTASAAPPIGTVVPPPTNGGGAPPPSIGVQIAESEQIRIARCRIESVGVGIFAAGNQKDLILEDNVIEFGANPSNAAATFGIVIQGTATACCIEGNRIRGALAGIIVNGSLAGRPAPSADATIATKNIVTCASAPAASGTATGTGPFGIDVAGSSSIVSQNIVKVPGGTTTHTAIRVTGQNIGVIDNHITVDDPSLNKSGGVVGIQVGYAAEETFTPTSDVRVAGNVVDGCRFAIAATTADEVIVESNLVDIAPNIASETDNVGISLTKIGGGQVQGNRVRGGGSAILCAGGVANRVSENVLSNGSVGVTMNAEIGPMVSQNRIDSMMHWGVICTGISGRCDIVENRVTSCGFDQEPGVAIGANQVAGELHVEANEVMNTGLSADGKSNVKMAYGISGTAILEACIESNLVTYSNPASRPPTGEDRALIITCLLETTTPVTLPQIDVAPATQPALAVTAGARALATGTAVSAAIPAQIKNGFAIQILGNKFIGTGLTALVQVAEQVTNNVALRFERVMFSNNYCLHLVGDNPEALRPKDAATVWMMGRSSIMMGNHIKATTSVASVNFNNMPGPFIGNVTRGGVLNHTEFPAPQSGFNQTF